MTTLPTTDEVLRWVGQPVQDDSGAHLGSCQNVYADDDTRLPEWVEVALTADGVAFVPIVGASSTGEVVRVAHSGERIAASPRFPSDEGLSPADEKALYDHYGVAYSGERSDSLLPADGDGGAEAATPPARRLRRIELPPVEPVAAPAPASVSTLPPPPYQPADSGSGRGKLALLAAVPAALLLARRGGLLPRLRREEPSAARRQAPRAGVLLAPAAAGVVATLVQRRRTRTPVTPAVMPTPHVVQPPEVVDREAHTPV